MVNLRRGKVGGAIVADESAPELKMGQGSIALADALGIGSNPRYGGIERGVAYVIYPGSGNGKPRLLTDIITKHPALFSDVGCRQAQPLFTVRVGSTSLPRLPSTTPQLTKTGVFS